MPGGADESPALALARSALARAGDAERKAKDAAEDARLAHARIDELLRPSLPPMRGRAPSVEDLVEKAATEAAEKVAEQTGSHFVSERVRTIVRNDRNGAIVAAVRKVAFVVVSLLLAFFLGHLAWK